MIIHERATHQMTVEFKLLRVWLIFNEWLRVALIEIIAIRPPPPPMPLIQHIARHNCRKNLQH